MVDDDDVACWIFCDYLNQWRKLLWQMMLMKILAMNLFLWPLEGQLKDWYKWLNSEQMHLECALGGQGAFWHLEVTD